MTGLSIRVADLSECARLPAESIRTAPYLTQLDLDACAQIDLGISHDRCEAAKRQTGILLGVTRNDESATAAQQLVHTEVLDMAAIGHVHERASLRHSPEQLAEQIERSHTDVAIEATPLLRGITRVGKPVTETHIQHGHD